MKCPKCGFDDIRGDESSEEITRMALRDVACENRDLIKNHKKQQSRIEELEAQVKHLTKELGVQKTEHECEISILKHTIVATIGGVDYEGFPTSEINYLQRLRILLEKEAQLAATKLRWQTGKPPKDGWYWVLFANKQWIGWYLESDMFFCGIEDQKNSCHWGECHWAGPLEPPEEE